MGYYKVPIYGASWGIAEVSNVLQGILGSGKRDTRLALEQLISDTVDGRPVLLNSGRSAIELALNAIRNRSSDPAKTDVLVPSLICKAVPDKIVRAGFKPKFFDSLPEVSPDPAKLLEKLGPSVAAVVFPYLYGRVVDISDVVTACRSRGIPVIEDCAASFLLSNESGELAGTKGDYVLFSFSIGKTLVAGAGGAYIDRTGAPSLTASIQSWTPAQERRLARGKIPWMLHYVFKRTGYFLQKLTGTLGRDYYLDTIEQVFPLSKIDSALVMQQFRKWQENKERKKSILERYKKNLSTEKLVDLPQLRGGQYVNRLFVDFKEPILSRSEAGNVKSDIKEFLNRIGIQTQLPYFPAHKRKRYAVFAEEDFRCTDILSRSLLEIPSQPNMTTSDVDFVCEAVIKSAALRFSVK